MEKSWEYHKERIRNLYLVEDMTRKQVMREMEEAYEFKADAGQYERHFKKWGFRKNLNAKEWQFVSRRIKKRKREGRETDLQIDGVQVPAKKLKKAISRYGQETTLERLDRNMREEANGRSPTPGGLIFSTPSPPPITPSSVRPQLSSTTMIWSRPMSPLEISPGIKFSRSTADFISGRSPCSASVFSPPSVDILSLPWYNFAAKAAPWIQQKPEALQNFGGEVTSEAQAAAQRLANSLTPKLDAKIMSPFQQKSNNSSFAAFMAAVFAASNHIPICRRRESSGVSIPEEDLFGMVEVFHALKSPDILQALKFLDSDTMPTLDALSEQLFKVALLTQDISLTKLFLTRFKFDLADFLPGPWRLDGIRLPHSFSCCGTIDSRPPLQVAIETENVQLVQLLLDHGADISIRGADDCDMLVVAAKNSTSAVLHLILKSFEGHVVPALLTCLCQDDPATVQLLWDRAKSSISSLGQLKIEVLVEAAGAGNIPIILDLLEHGADVNDPNRSNITLLQAAVSAPRACLEVVKLLVSRGAEFDLRSDDFDVVHLTMPTLLRIAVYDNFELAMFLVHAGADPNAKKKYEYSNAIENCSASIK